MSDSGMFRIWSEKENGLNQLDFIKQI